MIRILYVERPRSVGGSVISLFHLVANLNRAVYEPLVLFHRPNPYGDRFKAIGVPVITLNDTPTGAVPPAQQAHQRDIAATLSQYSHAAATGYRTAKFIYHLLCAELPLARRIRRVIEAQAVDLVHANNSLPNNRPSVLAARWAAVPVICHFRMFKTINAFDRWLGRHAAAHVYISKSVADHHIAQGLPAEKARVIYNAVDLSQFDPAMDSAAVRREFGLQPEHLVVGNVGRLDWWKGHDVFLRAVASLAGHMPGLYALVVGGVDNEPVNQAYAADLRALTRELLLSERVIFAGHRDDVPSILPALDLVVHSATQPEPFGRVVIEALSARRPVVAAAAGGVPEIVEDGIEGLLVPPGDVGALAGAMATLLSDGKKAKAMAQAGYQRVCRQFTVQKQVSAVQTLYQSVLAAQGSAMAGSLRVGSRADKEIC